MAYAKAAGSGNPKEKRYFNGNMVQCFARNVPLDDLVEALEKENILPLLTAIQRVKYNVMYALVSEDFTVLENLVLHGLDVGEVHLTFFYHKKKYVNVFVSNVPFGVKAIDVQMRLSDYGLVKSVRMIYKDFRGYKLPTGDWSVSFERLNVDIPSYILIRGWSAYIKYEGQPQTCRNCNQTGHIFANCPQRQNDAPKSEETPQDNKPENMETNEMPDPKEPNPTEKETRSTPSMQEENPDEYKPTSDDPSCSNACQEILENLERNELSHVTVEDCQTPTEADHEAEQNEETLKSQAWADTTEESCADGSEKPQGKEAKVGPTVYCSFCRMDSHTEDQCGKVVIARQSAKRKLGRKDNKPYKNESLGKKRRNIQKFKDDIESVVMEREGSDVQYIVGSERPEELYALWLVSQYGHRLTARSTRSFPINRNTRVMDLWSKYSSENMSRFTADEHLARAYEQLHR